MYEDMKPLFANPVLPLLAIALANHAFQDYGTFEEIVAIPSPADEFLHHLRIKNDMLRTARGKELQSSLFPFHDRLNSKSEEAKSARSIFHEL